MTHIRQVIRDDVENEMQVFVLIGVPHDPDLTFGGPGKQLRQVVNDDGNLVFKIKIRIVKGITLNSIRTACLALI